MNGYRGDIMSGCWSCKNEIDCVRERRDDMSRNVILCERKQRVLICPTNQKSDKGPVCPNLCGKFSESVQLSA